MVADEENPTKANQKNVYILPAILPINIESNTFLNYFINILCVYI